MIYNHVSTFKKPNLGSYYFNARWYDAETGRFISEDPARDGQNWFNYVSNNPIKYIDPTGMYITGYSDYPYYMQSAGKTKIGRSNYSMEKYGCAVTHMAKSISQLTGNAVNLKNLATSKSLYTKNGNIDWSAMEDKTGLNIDRLTDMSHDDIVSTLGAIASSNTPVAVGAEVKLSNDGGSHFVGVNGMKEINGKMYVEVDPTSINDISGNSFRKNWKQENGKLYIPVDDVEGLVVATADSIPDPEEKKDPNEDDDEDPNEDPYRNGMNDVPEEDNHPSSEDDTDPVGE